MKTAISERNKLTPQEAARFAELSPVIKRGMASFMEVATALLEISDSRLYRENYSTFKEYVEAEHNISVGRAYQLCQAAEVVKSLPKTSTMVDSEGKTKLNERQIREVAKVPAQKRAKVLIDAATNSASEDRAMTAKDIREAAVEISPSVGLSRPTDGYERTINQGSSDGPIPPDCQPKPNDEAWLKAIGTTDARNFYASQLEDIGSSCVESGSVEQLKALELECTVWAKKLKAAVKNKQQSL